MAKNTLFGHPLYLIVNARGKTIGALATVIGSKGPISFQVQNFKTGDIKRFRGNERKAAVKFAEEM